MRNSFALAVVLASLAFVACGDSSEDTAAPTQTSATPTTEPPAAAAEPITIKDFSFGPGDLTVAVGATVTWTNAEDGVAHTTTSDDELWRSGSLNTGDAFSFTFDTAGAFTYFCSIHPNMTGSVTVTG